MYNELGQFMGNPLGRCTSESNCGCVQCCRKRNETEPCGECGRPVLIGGEGVCYQCQCELHQSGVIDIDNDPWNGPAESVERDQHDRYDEDECIVHAPAVDSVRRTPSEPIESFEDIPF